MLKQFFLGIFLFVFTTVKAQELNCSITVNADQIQVSNNQVFKNLENSLTEFINQTKWTKTDFKKHEKIKCAISILLTEQTGTNSFKGTLQVQASRPVFNSSYYSPILNHKDNSFTFNYTQFQALNFNINNFESNLVSVMSYYSYFIIGLYEDTFSKKGGNKELNVALTIANQAQQSGFVGWDNTRTKVTRFTLIDQLLSANNETFRDLYYKYHFDALDSFERNQKQAAQKLSKHLESLKTIENYSSNILVRMMMDAKADEIVNIYSKNRGIKTTNMVSILKKSSSVNSKKWKQIYSN